MPKFPIVWRNDDGELFYFENEVEFEGCDSLGINGTELVDSDARFFRVFWHERPRGNRIFRPTPDLYPTFREISFRSTTEKLSVIDGMIHETKQGTAEANFLSMQIHTVSETW